MPDNSIIRPFPRLVFLALVSLVVFWGRTESSAENASRPNFVFILVDDLGWTDLGCYGSSFYETPNLDEFSSRSLRFTNAYSASPVCSPTRAAIMTGRHPVRVNITDWIKGYVKKDALLKTPEDRDDLALKEVTIAEVLRDSGYETFFAGKWHLGYDNHFPEDQGFDHNIGGHHKGRPPGGYYAPYNNPRMDSGPEGEYLTDRLTQESIDFLDYRNAAKPFLLFLSFYTVHTPIQGCDQFDAYFEEKRKKLKDQGHSVSIKERRASTRLNQSDAKYAAMVKSMDLNVGRLLAALDERNLSDNTVVIFTSDNGGLSTQPKASGGPTSVKPLRAGKGWCYEGGIRVPLMIHLPDGKRAGQIESAPVISMDFFPTMLELAELEARPDLHNDGLSLASLSRSGSPLSERLLYWHFPHYHGTTWAPGSAIRFGDYKLIEHFEEQKSELYNLASDIGETNDLSDAEPAMKKRLQEMANRWRAQHNAQVPVSKTAVE